MEAFRFSSVYLGLGLVVRFVLIFRLLVKSVDLGLEFGRSGVGLGLFFKCFR